MKLLLSLLKIIMGLMLVTNPDAANAQTCANENSEHIMRTLRPLLNDIRYETDRIESGIQNLGFEDLTRLTTSEYSELCAEMKLTTLYLNHPPTRPHDVSFFKTSNRRLIVYFFSDTLPSDNDFSFTSGPLGLIRIFDDNLEHVFSVSIQ